VQLGLDPAQHGAHVVQDLVVAEAEHPDPACGERLRSHGVARPLLDQVVHAAVHLHAEPRGVAVEVQDEAIERVLPAELRQPPPAQAVPEPGLGGGHRPAELPRPDPHLLRRPARPPFLHRALLL